MQGDDELNQLCAELLVHFDQGRSKITPLKVHQILTFGTESDRFLLGLYQRVAAWLDAERTMEEESITNDRADLGSS